MNKGTSRTKIKRWTRRKLNTNVKEIIAFALKHSGWKKVAKVLASSTREYPVLNLWQIDKQVSQGETVVIPGKVLSKGELTKKIKICALSISGSAKEKLEESKSEFVYLFDELKKNPGAEGVKLLR